MSDTANTLPEQIIETSRAFTHTLELENMVFQGQVNSAIEMTVHAFRELVTLCKEAIAIGNTVAAGEKQNLADAAQQALSDVQTATSQANTSPPASTTPIVEAVLDAAILHAVAQSYNNAVTAQQQMYITQQATATQIISTILSVATATLGNAVEKAESGGN